MDIERDLDYLKRHLSLHLRCLLPTTRCNEMIARYNDAQTDEELAVVKEELINECMELVFTDEINELLTIYFQAPFEAWWSTFDVVGCAGPPQNLNAHWHLDGGSKGMHKLFIYLNPVAEHGGNTVMVDQERTKRLRIADALPIESEKRKEDLSEVFEELGISPELIAYDLEAGDGLLFDPQTLAHRCQPTMPGKWRYTVCFTIVPQPRPRP